MSPSTLVIDIGGTNTRVALATGPRVEINSVRRFRNADTQGFGDVLQQYLGETGVTPYAACVAGAGPVRDAVLELTNLDWVIDRAALKAATGAQVVSILNDLQAQGHAVDALAPSAVTTLLPGASASPQAAKLVINIGTGMNVAPVYRLNGQTLVPPAEAGHVLLPAHTDQERAFAARIREVHGIATVEEALSGRGLEAVYAFVSGHTRPASEFMQDLSADPHVAPTLRLFSSLMGRISSDLALIHLPFGGIYLVGGVARNVVPYLMESGFGDAFREKGRFSEFLDQFPVYAVDDDYAALTGCAAHMAEMLA